MGIIVECPSCRTRGSVQRKVCKAVLSECPLCKSRGTKKRLICKKCEIEINGRTCICNYNVQKSNSKNYWIEYYLEGKRTRERIGRSKHAAENRFREVQTAKAEGRNIRKNKNAMTTLGELRDWCLDLAEVQQKRSYKDIQISINTVIQYLGEKMSVNSLEPKHIESFRKSRLTENTMWGRPAKPSTVNRNVANFRAMLNRGVDYGKLESNPVGRIRQLEENNVRERLLTQEEFEVLYSHCTQQIKGPVLIAFYLPMRKAEILNLTWDKIDFKNGFIRLGQDTKNKTGRVVPMHHRVVEYLQNIPRPIHGGYVFKHRCWNRKAYIKALKLAGLEDFTFHDLRHCAINNLRLAGNDHFAIKRASGHKTDIAFQRYNLVTEEEMKGMKWLDEMQGESRTMDTYMDTKANLK